MTRQEDDELDSMMGSMRSVWRDMRDADAEPPARGLDALMSAARAKAVEMAPPAVEEPWWRRAFAVLLRPPMLAAATVVVLVGGAVVLNQRGGSDVSTATTTTADVPAPPGKGRDNADKTRDEQIVDQAAGAGSAVAVPAGDLEIQPPVALPERPRPIEVRPPAVKRPPVVTGIETGKVEDLPPETEKTAKLDPEPDPKKGATDGKLQIANEEEGGPLGGRGPSAPAPDVAPVEPTTTDTIKLNRPSTPRPTASTDQLIKQTETAAARNDCGAARVTAARIRKQDPEAFRTRVVTKPAIARCLK